MKSQSISKLTFAIAEGLVIDEVTVVGNISNDEFIVQDFLAGTSENDSLIIEDADALDTNITVFTNQSNDVLTILSNKQDAYQVSLISQEN